MELLSLPAELITSVFSFLSPKHIKEARLVCRTFCQYSSRYLIDTAFAGSATKTLERLEEISRHEIFSKAVTTVVCSPCSLKRDYKTLDDYYEDLREVYKLRIHPEKTIPTRRQCRVHWHKYRQLYADQVRVMRAGSDRTRIFVALQRMPNVKYLVLSCVSWKSPMHPLHAVFQAGKDLIIKPTYDPPNGRSQLSRSFKLVSSALIANKIRLESLVQTEPMFIDEALRSNCFTKDKQHLFEPLRMISLHFMEESAAYLDRVQNCLFAAKHLEHLRLGVELLDVQTSFTVLLDNSWPNLTSVRLQFDFDYDLFVSFCRKNKSVRSLHLNDSGLCGGTWEELVLIMRQCFRLTDAWMEGLSEGNGYHIWVRATEEHYGDLHLLEAEHYLLHGGENPFGTGALELEDM